MTTPAARPPLRPEVVGFAAQPRRRKIWDVALSIVLLMFTIGSFLIGAVFSLLGFAFTDNCPPATCDVQAGTSIVFTMGISIAVFDLLATIGTIALLVVRFRAWWLAALALVATIVGWIVSFALYGAAIS